VEQLKRSLPEVAPGAELLPGDRRNCPRAAGGLDSDLRVLVANRAFYDALQLQLAMDGAEPF